MIDVKVCKFVEGNPGLWHGYPNDYRRENEDVICDNAIRYWGRQNLAVAYILFRKKYYHLHEEYLASFKK